MKLFILFALPFMIAHCVFAQDAIKQNTIYLELGGAGLFTSVNYERQLFSKPSLGFRAGIGTYSFDPLYLTVPVGLIYLLPTGNNGFFDIAINGTYTKADADLSWIERQVM